MPDFLLEIGSEEIPARMLTDAQNNLYGLVHNFLSRHRLIPTNENWVADQKILVFSTPRRLTAVVKDLLRSQPDVIETLQGPPVRVAYQDGVPTAAAEAFAKKVGLPVKKLKRTSTTKGEYVSAEVRRKGKNASAIIAEEFGWEFERIQWAKKMYWRKGRPELFVRPVRWIVALLDSKVVKIEFAGVRAGRNSLGHRILGPKKIPIAGPGQYLESLRYGHVLVDPEERRQRIRKGLDAAMRIVSHARWREDAELLDTVVNLTEWPSVVLGNFDPRFLALPDEVLVTVMRDHQKYFAIEDASRKLSPYFLAVLNTDNDSAEMIRHGNERVLRARFNDAKFFWDTDQKIPLPNRVEMLKFVTFQKDLGNYYDKTQRVCALATNTGAGLRQAGTDVHHDVVYDAAHFSKADLTTELVKEFTELQGIIGGLYVRAHGLHGRESDPQFVCKVADAIYDQYKPASMEDSVPRTLEGAVLSIADKADSIAGMFALGLVPTGSKDPFALRRQANGIVKTVAEHKLPVAVASLMEDARLTYDGSQAEKKFTLRGQAYDQAVRDFFRERLEFYLRDALGLAYDVVNAALAADANDVVDAIARAQAVAKVRPSPDFESISISFKRMKNILRQAAETNKRVADPFDAAALKEKEEKNLAAQVPQVAVLFNVLRTEKQYEPALLEISKLRPAIDAFFDKVMVMVEDEALRANRLGLLQTLVREFSSIADFSEIVTEGKEKIG